MPGCAPMTFDGVTQDVWDSLKARARGIGVPLPDGDAGSATAQGATLQFRREGHTLTLTFTELPAWAGCADVGGRVREVVRACGGS